MYRILGRSVPQNSPIKSFVSRLRVELLGGLILLQLMGCSPATNVLGLIAAGSIEDDAGAMLSRSKLQVDEGDYQGALDSAQRAFQLAPDCAACAVQLGYCHLGVAGLDLFQLAKKMLDNASEEGSSEAETSAPALAESNAAGQLASLATLVGLTDEDYAAITLPGNRLGALEGAPSTGPFRSLPVLLPKTATDARDSDSSTLHHIARAVEVICPFMNETVKIMGEAGDIRHTDPSCERSEGPAKVQSNALFIWAMAHLVEAIAFHGVVLYQPDGAVPHLQQRAALLENRSIITSLSEYVASVKDLAAVVDIILPTESEAARASMLTAMFNDLQTVSLAFQNMLAVPPSLSKGIVDAIAQLQGQKDQINTGGPKDSGSVAFKDQLTEGMATELKKQISTKIDSGQLNEQDKIELCSAYRQISTQAFASCDSP